MKILFSIIINALILFIIAYMLGANSEKGLEPGVILGCLNCSFHSPEAWKIYIIGGIILGLINVTIKPILKILSIPLFFVFLGLVTIIINAIVLYTLNFIINDLLVIEGVRYEINGIINFIIAVAIFSILNMFYSILFSKR